MCNKYHELCLTILINNDYNFHMISPNSWLRRISQNQLQVPWLPGQTTLHTGMLGCQLRFVGRRERSAPFSCNLTSRDQGWHEKTSIIDKLRQCDMSKAGTTEPWVWGWNELRSKLQFDHVCSVWVEVFPDSSECSEVQHIMFSRPSHPWQVLGWK